LSSAQTEVRIRCIAWVASTHAWYLIPPDVVCMNMKTVLYCAVLFLHDTELLVYLALHIYHSRVVLD
jgi:hypothetical protein